MAGLPKTRRPSSERCAAQRAIAADGAFVGSGWLAPLAGRILYDRAAAELRAFGLRTPWTLSNDRVWTRTHRLAGYTMSGAGLLIIAAAVVLRPDVINDVVIAAIVTAIAGPVVYSYLTWKREMKQ